MRVFACLCALFLLLPSIAGAATVTCTIPDANVARTVQLCEELRQSSRVRSAEWSNQICANQLLRAALVADERRVTNNTASQTVTSTVNDAVVLFQSTWPQPARATCGDGILDTEPPFNEACDDGNTVNGDGCSNSCGIE